MTLQGEHMYLRALEPSDLDFLYQLENDESIWEVSNTTTPYSKFILKQYLENAHRDIYEVKQLRLAICLKSTETVIGFIDLFDFEPKHKRVGLGIVIASEEKRGKGYASEAVQRTCAYAFTHLNVHQLYANITSDNKKSIHLFEKLGFKKSGEKKDWIFSEGRFKNELLYQLIHE
ncbi:MAG: GNAT family N-acetyltransferase [Flavobacteriaceae bacterium]|nr:GNAT family N-acetyltransferase [Flavobacteriaceae bacterium]